MAIADIYQKATLVQIPSGYKSGTLYSVLPNTADGDFTVSADADATRVNADGLIENVVADQARLNYNFIDGVVQPDPYLLLEPSRANFIVRSEEFNLWGDTGVTVTENATIAPTGAQTADLLTSTANNWRRSISYSISNGTVYSFSCFVKKHTTTDNIRFELYKGSSASFLDFVFSTQALSASDTSLTDLKVENYPNDWYRVSCKFTANGTNFICYAYPSQGYGTSGSAYFWGAQLEQGNYPTSYIPTEGSAVTRTADTCEKTSVASGIIGQTEGVIFIDFENFGQVGTSYGSFIRISDANDSTDRVIIQNSAEADNRIILVVRANSSTLFQPREDIPTGRVKIAFKYKSGDIDVFVNGVKEQQSTSTFSFENTLNKIQIGQPNKVHQAMIFNEALSDAELIELTS